VQLVHNVAVGVFLVGLFCQMLDDAAFVVPGAAFGDNGKHGAGVFQIVAAQGQGLPDDMTGKKRQGKISIDRIGFNATVVF